MTNKNLGRVVGLSAYEIWLQEGNTGTKEDFLKSLNGKDGTDGKNGVNGITPHIGSNGNWFVGDTDTEQPSVLKVNTKIQYVKKSNLTDGQFWVTSGGNVVKYTYANYTTLEPFQLPAGQYYVSAISAPYSFVVSSDGTTTRFDTFAPESAGTVSSDFLLNLTETMTLYLAYYNEQHVTDTTPYLVNGNAPLSEYFEGEEKLSFKYSVEHYVNHDMFVESYIKDCELVANELEVSGNDQGHYTGVKMDSNIERIMCKAKFVPNGHIALITTNNGSSTVTNITGGSLHLVFSISGCAIGIFNTNGTLRNIGNCSYSIKDNTEVSFGFSVNESTNTITVYLPDGTTQTINDSEVSVRNGQYAIWEHYCSTSNAGFKCSRMTKLWCKDMNGEILDDKLKRLDGAIGVAPTGQVYRQFTTHNLRNRDFS